MTYHGVMDLTRDDWLGALDLAEGDIPRAVIMEGSWWRALRNEWRLGYLDEVRELAFPDMFWGRWRGSPVVYSCVYGAPRAVELAHLFAVLGSKLVVTIGTCGAVRKGLNPGDVVVPERVVPREGIARLYGSAEVVEADSVLSARARQVLSRRGVSAHDVLHLTWHSIFAQTAEMVEEWHGEGIASVDMEAATALAVARHFGVPSIAMLVVWDLLDRGTSFLDPLGDEHQQALDRGNLAVFETALSLVDSVT